MKTKKVTGKGYEFANQPEGMVFLGVERVQVLDRATGRQRTLALSTLENDLPPAKFKLIDEALLMNGIFTNAAYQVMGIAEESL